MDALRPTKVVSSSTSALFVSTLLVLLYLVFSFDLGEFGVIDLLQYWAAAKVILVGGNPYDVTLLEPLQRSVSSSKEIPIRLWNPPFVFSWILPYAAFGFSTLVKAWLIVGSLLILIAARLSLLRYLGRESKVSPVILLAWILILSFYPFYISLAYGQVTPVLFIGFVLFLFRYETKQDLLAGIFLSLTILKPHLLYLVYLALLLDAIRSGEWRVLAGLSFGVALLAIPGCFVDPAIFSQFFEAFSAPPMYWKNPNLGSWLQGALGSLSFGVRVIPAVVTCLVFLVLRPKLNFEMLLVLIPISLVTAPYGWVYDQMLVLPVLFWILSSWYYQLNSRLAGYILLILSVPMVLISKHYGQEFYVWYPAAIAIFAIITYRALRGADSQKAL